MGSIMLRASEHWSKVIKQRGKSEILDFAGSFASKQRCLTRRDTGKPSLQASRAEVAPNGPIYPPFKPLS